jgi:hypothetical protein
MSRPLLGIKWHPCHSGEFIFEYSPFSCWLFPAANRRFSITFFIGEFFLIFRELNGKIFVYKLIP